MNSFAVWCKKNEDVAVNLDVHFNFWKLPSSEKIRGLYREYKYEYFLDIGLKVKNIKPLDSINVYFPFLLKDDDIQDLGNVLIKDRKLINGIFNDDCTLICDKQAKVIHSDKREFIVYPLNEYNFKLEPKYNGTIMSIEASTIDNPPCPNYYYRFRIRSRMLEQLTRKHNSQNSFFENANSITEVIDFRLNEKRNYHESMAEEIPRMGEFIIDKIHFLLLLDAKDELVSPGISFSCRELEKHIWSPYIGDEYMKRNIIAYHWKAGNNEKAVESFNSLIKIKFAETNASVLKQYFWTLFGITLIFNIVSSYIVKLLDRFISLFS